MAVGTKVDWKRQDLMRAYGVGNGIQMSGGLGGEETLTKLEFARISKN